MGVNPIPEGYHTVTPYLVVEGAATVLDFVKQAFGAEEKFRMATPNGKIGHAEVKIGDSIVMMGDAGEEHPAMPAMIYLYVEDCDATYERALAAGGDVGAGARRISSTATARRVFATRPATCGGSQRTWRTCPRTRWQSASKRRPPRRRAEQEASVRFRKGAKLDPSQVEDYRGQGGGLGGLGGGKVLGGGGGLIGIVVLVLYLVIASQGGGLGRARLARRPDGRPGHAEHRAAQECRTGQDANEREDCRIVAVINSVQAYWTKTLRNYEPARTRFFDGQISTGCGAASSAVGPFYCPADGYVYIDLGFFDQLQSQLGADGGPLAEAYILAHEYGHHVQDLTGVLRSANRDTGPQGGQVRVELQADCYAGLWVGRALDTGFVEDITRQDVNQALDAAAAVGDDRIQERAEGRVTPESWTHGSSDQRRTWFVRGIEGSGPDSCDTFKGQV